MAALTTARNREIYMGSEICDSLSLLDVLDANQFEEESLEPEVVKRTEENFYRGAPPDWLNFHISDQAESHGNGTSFIKRDGYNRLKQKIQSKRKLPRISTVKLLHQPGCGGTTLAMQVLWDLRKTFRCAVLTGSFTDITNVATEVVHLFTAGGQGSQNTVLLLLNEHMLDKLQESIMEKIAEQKVVVLMPVAIFLICVRKDAVLHREHVVLRKELSDTEKQKFNEKQNELRSRYGDECSQFHGFNIMRTNFSQAYVKEACTIFSRVQRANKPLKTQLAAFLSLLNAYVPGSYLLESQCLDFLKPENSINGQLSLEDRMRPFSHFIVTFQQDIKSEKRVRMAHPMIAQRCTELMGEAGVTRSDTARNFLNCLCRGEYHPRFLGFVKDMLTKREMKIEENPINGNEAKEEQERFSRLILDIQKKESKAESASVLKVASKIFVQNAFFPQALARVYYIEVKDYNQAERWAKEAKRRDPYSSFVADTLGQVYKNHLKNIESPTKPRHARNKPRSQTKPREILQLATKAIQAFKDEEELAENEHDADMNRLEDAKAPHVFNTTGQFGYLQVCNLVYDQLVRQNETWKRVLTKNVSLGSVLESLGDNKLYRFNGLISSFRDEVEKKCNFLNAYLTFSKPGKQKNDPSSIQVDVSSCYYRYTEQPLTDLSEDIMKKFEDNVVENTSLSDANTPQPHIVSLLKEWPEDNNNNNSSDFMRLIEKINQSYENAYAKYFGSRYLCPLFYLGKDEAVSKMAPMNSDRFLLENEDATTDFVDYMTKNNKIFKDLRVQKNLLKFHGVIVNYKLFANIGGTRIVVSANMQENLWIQREVSFYLGFNIRGLVAFGIQTKNTKHGPRRSCDACGGIKDFIWTRVTPDCRTEDSLPTYRECTLRSRSPMIPALKNVPMFPFLVPAHLNPSPNKEDTILYLPRNNGMQPHSNPQREPLRKGSNKNQVYGTGESVESQNLALIKKYDLRLQSEAGHFKCSVSGLRWVCKENVSFTYQFRSWEEHRQKLDMVDCEPGGPLMDIVVTGGELDEVHLPHWVCVDGFLEVSDKFAVLHRGQSGNFLEEVSEYEVTSSHVRLFHPSFSTNGVLITSGFPVKAHCNLLIYRTNQRHLTLHIYVILRDPARQQAVELLERASESKMIQKTNPKKSFDTLDSFTLTTDADNPQLSVEHNTTYFFKVFIKNAASDFKLMLADGKKHPVWACVIKKDEYRHRSQTPGDKRSILQNYIRT